MRGGYLAQMAVCRGRQERGSALAKKHQRRWVDKGVLGGEPWKVEWRVVEPSFFLGQGN